MKGWMKAALMSGVALYVVLHPVMTFECGPFLTVPVFVTAEPDNVEEFMDGNLGVLRPSFSRQNLLVAYRAIAGVPLTVVEKASLQTQLAVDYEGYGADSNLYTKERGNIPGLPAAKTLLRFKSAGDFEYFPNCGADAMRAAASTLRERVNQFGRESQQVRDWVLAQDRVFENCDKNANSIPEPAPADAAAVVKADREYQIAAANFYTGNYDESATLFQKIGGEKWSQWHDWGLYLAGRSYIRKATLKSANEGEEKVSLSRAEALLREVTTDPKLAAMKPKAESLLEFIGCRLDPKRRASELQRSIAKATPDNNFNQHVHDYLKLIADNRANDDEMADWIMMISGREPAIDPIARWKQEPKAQPWLVAALMYAKEKSPEADDLIEAGLRISETSSAYATVRYHLARLESERENHVTSKKMLDDFLSKYAKSMHGASLNMFLALRSANSTSLEDFAKFGDRGVIAWDYGEGPEQSCSTPQPCPPPMPDGEASKVINHLTVEDLIALSKLQSASAELRVTSARLAFTRSLILGDDQQLRESAAVLASVSQELGRNLKPILEAKSPSERKVEAVLAVIAWPGGSYRIDPANSRLVASERDSFRQVVHYRTVGSFNWWCDQEQEATPQISDPKSGYPSFLSDAKRKKAEQELSDLKKSDPPPVFFGEVLLPWAKRSPDDPRVPVALQSLVRAVHYGCGKRSTEFGREAFQILHNKYSQSTAAKETKYWYQSN